MGKKERGRPSLGITKKVSLTLTESEWAKIEASGLTVAAFLKASMKNASIPNDDGILAVPIPPEQRAHAHETMKEYIRRFRESEIEATASYPRSYVEERWDIYLSGLRIESEELPPDDIIEAAKTSMFNIMYPTGTENAVVQTHQQYECPFTGKRFGSMDKLVRAAIPHLISAKITEKKNRAKLAAIREHEKEPKYFLNMR